MRRLLTLAICIWIATSGAVAQEVSVKLVAAPLETLFRTIEEQTPLHIYSNPADADTLRISISADKRDAIDVLREAVDPLQLKVSVFGTAVFVARGKEFVTTLPRGFYERDTLTAPDDIDIPQAVVAESKPDGEDVSMSYYLDEITVSTARLARVQSTVIGMERLAIREMKNIPTAFGEVDVMRVVLSLPGVKSVGEVSNGFNVRGGATDQNLILFNEGTIYNPTHLFGFFSAFNPDIIKDMELYKSSIPAKYGGRISSVLEINTREGSSRKLTSSASIGLLTSRLSMEMPLGSKTSVLVGGRTTYSDWILKRLPENSGYKDGSAGFYDLNATLSHRISNRNSFTVNGYYSNDRFRFNAYEHYAYSNANASVKWQCTFSDIFSGNFAAGYDHYGYSTSNTDNPTTAYRLSFGINQYFAKMNFGWYANDRHTVNFGINTLMYDLNPGSYLPEGESMVTPDRMQRERALENALYLSDRWDLTERLSLDLGLRYSLFGALGDRTYNIYEPGALPTVIRQNGTETGHGIFSVYQGPEYRASLRYAFAEDFSFKAGYNTMRQYIHKLSNTTIMSPTDTWKLSDPNIRPQTGAQLAAGLYKNFNAADIETSVEVYYKTMDNYLDYRQGAELLMNHHIETDVLPTQGKAFGVELMLRKTQGKLNGWMSYTYSRTLLRQNSPLITAPVNDGEWYPADFDKPHDFKLAGNYRFTHRFSISMNCDYSTGRPITLPVLKYQLNGSEFVYYSDRNQYRIPDFFRLDFSMNIEPTHHLTALTHSSFSLGVYNLTGRKNAYSVYYITEEGRLKGYRLAIFGMPIPYISYNIKF
ncbi:MAG: TonB-dependent receptor [Tannerella sp.]|jgi:hypothetical protein|nr:TonB-dependent receptor [Tannerella sp.]